MSSAFRITQRTVSTTMLNGLQSNLSRMEKIQQQLSSGKQVSRPSDSPVLTVESMQFRAGIRRTEQYMRNADDGLAVLGTTDSALTTGLDVLRRVRALTLEGMNDASNTQAREALATEIDTLQGGLLGVANTRYLDRPIFGGNSNAPDAYDATGTYVGDAGKVVRNVAPGVQVEVNVNGPNVFGGDGTSPHIFTVLKDVAAALRNGDSAAMHASLSTGLVSLDSAVDRVITTLGEIGARFNRVETMRQGSEDQIYAMRDSLAEAESIDLPKTIVDLQMQEVAYKAALSATARAVQPSLLDFLR